MTERLALLGGPKAINQTFPHYRSIGEEETHAAKKVLESGVLSQFLGCWEPDFYGGPKVQAFERAWETYFKVKHAVSVNSNTSGLIAAVGAIGIEPGDEVIVSPWTMCATATAILVWNGIPVFADIEEDTFNLDPASIRKNISKKTKAIIVTDIFGQAAKLDEILAIAKEHKLVVIEDAAQAPGAVYKDRFVGTIADIGVFSLNYHKHIHTGEGGVCVTNNPKFAERMQLIRNHAEAVVADKPVDDFTNLIGFNFRMGEIEAAIGMEQLAKLNRLASERVRMGLRFTEGLKELKGLKTAHIQPGANHVHYIYPIVLDLKALGVSRKKIVEALQAEGVPALSEGYQNVHLLPIYQKKIAYGKNGYPWKHEGSESTVSYRKGICPVAEKLHDETLINIHTCSHFFTDAEVDLVIRAFRKVWSQLDLLKSGNLK